MERTAVVAEDRGGERGVTVLERVEAEPAQEDGAEAVALPGVLDEDGDLRVQIVAVAVVPGHGDDLLAVDGHDRLAAQMVDLGEVVEQRLRRDPNRLEE